MGKILVIGGSRGTGLLIAQLLRQRGNPVRVLSRNVPAARARLDPAIEVIPGDLTRADTLAPALSGAAHLVLTAGVPSGLRSEQQIRETEYDGTRNVLAAAGRVGFGGRFLYMTACGVNRWSPAAWLLNLYKGNTLRWRCRAEAAIRGSGLDYTIVRAGILLDREAGTHAIRLSQEPLPLSFRLRIARADVARGCVAALASSRLSRSTFEVVWGTGKPKLWEDLFTGVKPDRDPDIQAGNLTRGCT